MFYPNRLSALLIIVTLGLVSFFSLPWPSRSITVAGDDVNISGKMLVAITILGLVATGSHTVASQEECDAPQCRSLESGAWILPTLACATALVTLNQMHEPSAQLLVCSATVAALAVLLLAVRGSVDPRSKMRFASRKVIETAGFTLTVLLTTAVRAAWPSGPIPGTVAGLCGAAVSYLLLSPDLISPWRATAYALVAGVVVGIAAQSAVAAVRTSAAFGFVVTVVLYVSIGLARGKLRGQLNRKRVLEYLLVAAAGLLMVMVSGL
jgi:hypothetical protein